MGSSLSTCHMWNVTLDIHMASLSDASHDHMSIIKAAHILLLGILAAAHMLLNVDMRSACH